MSHLHSDLCHFSNPSVTASVPKKGSYLTGFLILQFQTTGSVITPTLGQAGDNVFTWMTAKIFLCISQLTQGQGLGGYCLMYEFFTFLLPSQQLPLLFLLLSHDSPASE